MILADENIPYSLVKELRKEGIVVKYLTEEKRGITDEKVIELANKENLIILTLDSDFLRLRNKIKTGLILLRARITKENIYRIAAFVRSLMEKARNKTIIIYDSYIEIL